MHTLHQYLALFRDTLGIRHPVGLLLWMALPCVLYVAGWQVRGRRAAQGKLGRAGSDDQHASPVMSSVMSSTSGTPRPFDLPLAILLLMAGVVPVLFSLTLLTQGRINASNFAQIVGTVSVLRNYDTACREDPAQRTPLDLQMANQALRDPQIEWTDEAFMPHAAPAAGEPIPCGKLAPHYRVQDADQAVLLRELFGVLSYLDAVTSTLLVLFGFLVALFPGFGSGKGGWKKRALQSAPHLET